MYIEQLERETRLLCSMATDEVFDYLEAYWQFQVYHPDNPLDRYAVRSLSDKTLPLLVCHADTVRNSRAYEYDAKTGKVVSSELDDRLGIAVMLCLIADGLEVNCLVCDNEETGQSTAEVFQDETDLKPNWLTEFDRRGCDVVCYAYETPLLSSILEHLGLKIGQGSFSDISSLESLGVIGMNVGIGYHREHSLECNADLNDTLKQVARWLRFYKAFRKVCLKHEQQYDNWKYSYRETVTSKKTSKPYTWDIGYKPEFHVCDNCQQYCDAQTTIECNGGSVCEVCALELQGYSR